MTRLILAYGLISGFAVIGVSVFVIANFGDGMNNGLGLWFGYLTMLVALSSILVAVKQHRDQALGGVIRFWPALGLGLGIAVVAAIAYSIGWEIYLAATHYTFMDKFVDASLAAKRAAGVTGAAYAKAVAEGEAMRKSYANPVMRFGETFLEIFPVGVLVALVSAGLVRNPRFLPARSRPVAV
jgi:hypothetical protein